MDIHSGIGNRVRPGAPVFGADGDAVGAVAAVHPEYVVVEKGAFFPTDYFVPVAAITRIADDGGLHLDVSKEDVLNQAWQHPPDRSDRPESEPRHDPSASAAMGETIRIPLHEEHLVPVKRAVQRGAVRIEKVIVTEDRTITVPVTEERLRITRLAPANGAGEDADAFAEEVIEIPLRGEEVKPTTHDSRL